MRMVGQVSRGHQLQRQKAKKSCLLPSAFLLLLLPLFLLDPRRAIVMLADMPKKKPKSKPAEQLTAAAILARMRAAEAERQTNGRRDMSKRRRKQIKDKQRAAALRLWAPGGRLRKLQKERQQQSQQRRETK
jgi:hypothetical protein